MMNTWALRRRRFNTMLDVFSKFIEYIYKIEASPLLWILTFLSITFMRDFWENFIEDTDRIIDLVTHFDFSLFWIVLFFSLAIFMHVISGERMSRISRLLVYGFLVIFIAPPFDLLYYWGHFFKMTYVYSNPLFNFFTFYSGCPYGREAPWESGWKWH